MAAPLNSHEIEQPSRFAAVPEDRPQLSCPMAVRGTDVELVPIKAGEALVFTNAEQPPEELRRRALRFASEYDAGGGARQAGENERASPAGFATTSQYAEVVAGARVEIRPLADVNRPALRAHLERRVQRMRRTHRC